MIGEQKRHTSFEKHIPRPQQVRFQGKEESGYEKKYQALVVEENKRLQPGYLILVRKSRTFS